MPTRTSTPPGAAAGSAAGSGPLPKAAAPVRSRAARIPFRRQYFCICPLLRSFLLVPEQTTYCKGVLKVSRRKEFASVIHSGRSANSSREVRHGARTLAAIVPPAAGGRPRLLPEVRPGPAGGAGRRAALGRPARPAPVVGLPEAPLVHDHPAARPPAVPGGAQPPGRWRGRRPLLAGGGGAAAGRRRPGPGGV